MTQMGPVKGTVTISWITLTVAVSRSAVKTVTVATVNTLTVTTVTVTGMCKGVQKVLALSEGCLGGSFTFFGWDVMMYVAAVSID